MSGRLNGWLLETMLPQEGPRRESDLPHGRSEAGAGLLRKRMSPVLAFLVEDMDD